MGRHRLQQLSLQMKTTNQIYTFIFLGFLLSMPSCVFSQPLRGHWKVIKWVPLIRQNIQAKEDRTVYQQDSLLCTRATLVFTKDGSFMNPEGACAFEESHQELKITSTAFYPVVPSTDSSEQFPGLEVDDAKVSATLAALIGYTGKKLKVAITNYDIDWGQDSRLKIFYLEKSKIALFRGGDIVILKKISGKKKS